MKKFKDHIKKDVEYIKRCQLILDSIADHKIVYNSSTRDISYNKGPLPRGWTYYLSSAPGNRGVTWIAVRDTALDSISGTKWEVIFTSASFKGSVGTYIVEYANTIDGDITILPTLI